MHDFTFKYIVEKNNKTLSDAEKICKKRSNNLSKILTIESDMTTNAKHIDSEGIHRITDHLSRFNNLSAQQAPYTHSGTVNLNVNLLKAHSDVIEYIILHELCLLKLRSIRIILKSPNTIVLSLPSECSGLIF